MFVLGTADSYSQVMVSTVIQGLAWGVRSPVLTSMRGDYFGRRSFAVIMGFSHGIAMLGMIVGPLLSGYFADHFSYGLGFKVIAACTAPGFLLFVFLRSPQPKPTDP
jgi:MFS family permease